MRGIAAKGSSDIEKNISKCNFMNQKWPHLNEVNNLLKINNLSSIQNLRIILVNKAISF